MNVATLRVEGSEAALDQFLARLGGLPSARWKTGDARDKRGGVHEQSGLNLTIADCASSELMMETARAFLQQCRDSWIALQGPELDASLCVGVTVGTTDQFVSTVPVTADDMRLLTALGIALYVAAYPATEESPTDVTA